MYTIINRTYINSYFNSLIINSLRQVAFNFSNLREFPRLERELAGVAVTKPNRASTSCDLLLKLDLSTQSRVEQNQSTIIFFQSRVESVLGLYSTLLISHTEQLQEALTTALVLIHYRPKRESKLETDALDGTIVGVFSQK